MIKQTAPIKEYPLKTFTFDVDGISKKTLEEHYKLYEGYVKHTNLLNKKVAELTGQGKTATPEFHEARRRFGFEYNGMVLHEYYFAALKFGQKTLAEQTKLYQRITDSFGSYQAWEDDFKAMGKIRGNGWVILYQDSARGLLQNYWIGDHHIGHPVNLTPILVMDVWEHAYVMDFLPSGRKDYIEAFFKNIDWKLVESRLKA